MTATESERLREEARTIFTRIADVDAALDRARNEEGDHWEDGSIALTLERPSGGDIDVELDIEEDAAANAQYRYERAKELERRRDEREGATGPFAGAPPDPLAYLLLSHLKTVEGDYPRSMARNLDATREEIVDLCDRLEQAGLIERIESGMLKRRDVKLKRSLETHQHHTYYRLARAGDHLLRSLDDREGTEGFLRTVADAHRIARRIAEGGPDYPRMTAEDLDLDREHVERVYDAMVLAGIATRYDGGTIKGTERKLKPKPETHRHHTYYVTTREADRVLRELDG